MNPLDQIAERRIEEAIARGEFDDLPGFGRPLELEDLDRVPAELRASYLLLKGSNVLPEELVLRKELLTLGDLLRACGNEGERSTLECRRSLLLLRLERERSSRM